MTRDGGVLTRETVIGVSAGMQRPTFTHRLADPAPRGGRHDGFTLIEILVVMAIIGLIAALVAPQVFKSLAGAKSDAARAQVESLATGVDLYRLEVGSLPPDLNALIERPTGEGRWNGPYLRKQSIPKDPWDREYVFRAPGEHGDFDLYSLGADGVEGGEGDDRDINSWE